MAGSMCVWGELESCYLGSIRVSMAGYMCVQGEPESRYLVDLDPSRYGRLYVCPGLRA
jgi:hypothetical protein